MKHFLKFAICIAAVSSCACDKLFFPSSGMDPMDACFRERPIGHEETRTPDLYVSKSVYSEFCRKCGGISRFTRKPANRTGESVLPLLLASFAALFSGGYQNSPVSMTPSGICNPITHPR